jgi:hypothetical protein
MYCKIYHYLNKYIFVVYYLLFVIMLYFAKHDLYAANTTCGDGTTHNTSNSQDLCEKIDTTPVMVNANSEINKDIYVFYNTQDGRYRFDNVYLLNYMIESGGYIDGNNYYYGFENGIKEIGNFEVHFYIASGFYDASGNYSKDVYDNVYFNIKNTHLEAINSSTSTISFNLKDSTTKSSIGRDCNYGASYHCFVYNYRAEINNVIFDNYFAKFEIMLFPTEDSASSNKPNLILIEENYGEASINIVNSTILATKVDLEGVSIHVNNSVIKTGEDSSSGVSGGTFKVVTGTSFCGQQNLFENSLCDGMIVDNSSQIIAGDFYISNAWVTFNGKDSILEVGSPDYYSLIVNNLIVSFSDGINYDYQSKVDNKIILEKNVNVKVYEGLKIDEIKCLNVGVDCEAPSELIAEENNNIDVGYVVNKGVISLNLGSSLNIYGYKDPNDPTKGQHVNEFEKIILNNSEINYFDAKMAGISGDYVFKVYDSGGIIYSGNNYLNITSYEGEKFCVGSECVPIEEVALKDLPTVSSVQLTNVTKDASCNQSVNCKFIVNVINRKIEGSRPTDGLFLDGADIDLLNVIHSVVKVQGTSGKNYNITNMIVDNSTIYFAGMFSTNNTVGNLEISNSSLIVKNDANVNVGVLRLTGVLNSIEANTCYGYGACLFKNGLSVGDAIYVRDSSLLIDDSYVSNNAVDVFINGSLNAENGLDGRTILDVQSQDDFIVGDLMVEYGIVKIGFAQNNSTLYGENGLIKNSEVMVYDSNYMNNGFDFVNMVLDNSFVSVYNFLGSSGHAENILLTNGSTLEVRADTDASFISIENNNSIFDVKLSDVYVKDYKTTSKVRAEIVYGTVIGVDFVKDQYGVIYSDGDIDFTNGGVVKIDNVLDVSGTEQIGKEFIVAQSQNGEVLVDETTTYIYDDPLYLLKKVEGPNTNLTLVISCSNFNTSQECIDANGGNVTESFPEDSPQCLIKTNLTQSFFNIALIIELENANEGLKEGLNVLASIEDKNDFVNALIEIQPVSNTTRKKSFESANTDFTNIVKNRSYAMVKQNLLNNIGVSEANYLENGFWSDLKFSHGGFDMDCGTRGVNQNNFTFMSGYDKSFATSYGYITKGFAFGISSSSSRSEGEKDITTLNTYNKYDLSYFALNGTYYMNYDFGKLFYLVSIYKADMLFSTMNRTMNIPLVANTAYSNSYNFIAGIDYEYGLKYNYNNFNLNLYVGLDTNYYILSDYKEKSENFGYDVSGQNFLDLDANIGMRFSFLNVFETSAILPMMDVSLGYLKSNYDTNTDVALNNVSYNQLYYSYENEIYEDSLYLNTKFTFNYIVNSNITLDTSFDYYKTINKNYYGINFLFKYIL